MEDYTPETIVTQLTQATTDEDTWEIIEGVISYTQAENPKAWEAVDFQLAMWEAVAPHIPPSMHDDVLTRIRDLPSMLRERMRKIMEQK